MSDPLVARAERAIAVGQLLEVAATNSQAADTRAAGALLTAELESVYPNLVASITDVNASCRRIGSACRAVGEYLIAVDNAVLPSLALPAYAAMEIAVAPLRLTVPSACRLTGDPGGTLETDPRLAWHTSGDSGSERGQNVMLQALEVMSNSNLIGPDEIGVIKLDNNNLIFIIPGVTDLSQYIEWAQGDADSPVGYNREHQSLRDTDQVAAGSAIERGVDGNPLAQLIEQFCDSNGVPPGTKIAVIGHSFGSDTAFDLAADAEFGGGPGGGGRYSVTDVIGFGYDNDSQYADITTDAHVLGVQNSNDLVVKAERKLRPGIEILGGVGEIGDSDIADGFERVRNGLARRWINRGRTGVVAHDDHQTNVVFAGGDQGVGHHPNNYKTPIAFADPTSASPIDQAILSAANNLAVNGFTGSGTLHAIDVSKPPSKPPKRERS